MIRSLCVSLLTVCYVASEALGASGPLVATKPTLVCPQTDLGNEKLQAQYDQMWAVYSADVKRLTEKLQTELEKQFTTARDAGNLNLALFWQGALNDFKQQGDLKWNDADQRKTWGNRFGDAPFPAEFRIVVKESSEAYSEAVQSLSSGYQDLEESLTMAGDLPKALAIRSEASRLTSLVPQKDPVPASIPLAQYRSGQSKATLLQVYGGNPHTEKSVGRALKWLSDHQQEDGGWSFDVGACKECGERCRTVVAQEYQADRAGATGLAMLPFLASGYTDKTGPYKQQLRNAVRFLTELSNRNKGNLIKSGGSMSSQACAMLALSEARELTRDKRLNVAIQLALNHVLAQSQVTPGKKHIGWSARPESDPDTLTTAAVIESLRILHGDTQTEWASESSMRIVRYGAIALLDRVQGNNGAQYGLLTATDLAAASNCTAAGLASRLLLGRKYEDAAIQRGATELARQGPTDDILYDYYTTQVLFHDHGERWISWNKRMTDMLMQAQAHDGHAAGSWLEGFEKSNEAKKMGRLYVTCLSTLILECYYRYPVRR